MRWDGRGEHPGRSRRRARPGEGRHRLRTSPRGRSAGPGGAPTRKRAAVGRPDQCRTRARIAEIARRRFGVKYTLARLDLLMRRIGWSVQVPFRRTAERGEGEIDAWKDEQWPSLRM
ncbi:winged helix-turn-helix domain-containing protein [Streptomyces sp. NPDC048416]|uniref:helix-turn-helix domain-containing protein n=1 Tax=Streptomyces sp. NPDC048416 TaxID=3365546 RepID=UPI003723FAC9